MKYPIGQVFRVPLGRDDIGPSSAYPNLHIVTKGRHERGFDPQKGMFFYKLVRDQDGKHRRPAFIFYSTNNKRGSASNPWMDIIEEARGYALYHGDNRHPHLPPLEARGNRQFMAVIEQYSDPALRNSAPPVLLFEDQVVDGRAKGYRRFSGFGVPTNVHVQAQASQEGHFANLAIELALFSTDAEQGLFDWCWIDDRRDRSLTLAEANRRAPKSWQTWVRGGESALDGVRRNVLRARILSPTDQREMTDDDRAILGRVHSHYSSTPHHFEGLASLVAQRLLGPDCSRGWVTKRSGDGGIDFVSRLVVGTGFSTASLVVLGQAKVLHPDRGTVAGRDLARVTARLQRGWLGVFVTTGTFTKQAQTELDVDGYPIVLINGQHLAQVLRKEMATTGLGLEMLFEREAKWYASNLSSLPAENVLQDRRGGHELWRMDSRLLAPTQK